MDKKRIIGSERKQEAEIRAFLKKSEQPYIDEERKRRMLELLRIERKKLHVRSRKSYAKRVLEQAGYLSPLAWILQGAAVLFLGWLIHVEERNSILAGLLTCAPMLGVIGFAEILRSYQQNVWELEQACRYNLRQLMGMRLLIFGAVDSLLACCVIISGFQAGIRAEELLVFFLIPQMLSDSVYLYLMTRLRQRFQVTALIASGVMLTMFWAQIFAAVLQTPQIVEQLTRPLALLAVLLVSMGLLALSCTRFLQETETAAC